MDKKTAAIELDVIYGEYRDHTVVHDFVSAVRGAKFAGTLYIGYPVLSIDDGRVEYDAVLVSPDHGVVIFDLYSYQGEGVSSPDASAIPDQVSSKQEQLYAALYNKLNSFKDLRRGRNLLVELLTVTIFPLTDTVVEEDGAWLLSLECLDKLPLLDADEKLDESAVRHLNAAIQRISNLRPAKKRENVTRPDSKGAIIKKIEAQIANLDLWQKRGSIEYVNGPQRIRGLAGSGKTVVLALKVAYLHVKRPDWKIVVTFNTRSLYQQFEALIRRFVFAQVNDEPDWEKILVMHAWGNWERPGVYSTAVSMSGSPFRDFGTAARMFGYNLAFDGACKEALSAIGNGTLDLYDMILIDEAQDLPTSFFRLVYKMARYPKRIVWAYDDLQNLGEYQMPSEVELFGMDKNGKALVTLKNKVDEPQEDIVLPRCYRNPPWTLVTAHGLGFGIYRSKMVQMFPDPIIWRRLGYREIAGSLSFDSDVTVERDPQSVPEFFDRLLAPQDSLQLRVFRDREQQFSWIAKTISQLLEEEELQHSDFLIVLPDVMTSKSTGALVLKSLLAANLRGHIAGVTSSKDELFREKSIAVTHIFRAKGNEAPVVFVVDADFCEGPEIKKRRNVLFTAITRSRAWTYVCGVGSGMEKLRDEMTRIREARFRLEFHYPSKNQLRTLSVSSDGGEGGSVGAKDDEEVRALIRKVRMRGFDQLPSDVQQELINLFGQDPDESA
ncbi:DEAD/DEAH box helicase [Azospirillum halopraeferens]|uniref:DEAD/DEAH box helicase n=1 Tax=Azospirillum halopraeferens TaxID=34010 RepID=UPI0004278F34|nr:ATP-binding domain-containing protein [Azospirillum halopraeferens]